MSTLFFLLLLPPIYIGYRELYYAMKRKIRRRANKNNYKYSHHLIPNTAGCPSNWVWTDQEKNKSQASEEELIKLHEELDEPHVEEFKSIVKKCHENFNDKNSNVKEFTRKAHHPLMRRKKKFYKN